MPMAQGIGYLIGSGTGINFWDDQWIDGIILRSTFSRIFSLANKKFGKVYEFGYWDNWGWQWQMYLRKRLFDWEKDYWAHFKECLVHIHLDRETNDKLIWKCNPNCYYSPNSFCRSVLQNNDKNRELWRYVWAGLAPPKVEIFVWQVMKGRVVVKEDLVKRNLVQRDASLCTL
ncbi:Uncharacterized protein TCM_020961 [Theobroma cacao]|uniref:Reverse transcriptase zinc-binding domain-containing protein n=1 Tax=Theobroma cacao TaxID=3641 RepID=A0A061EM74_THECC|nr:Uncharacterized protein TCM_020961 [Theobroma cacao]